MCLYIYKIVVYFKKLCCLQELLPPPYHRCWRDFISLLESVSTQHTLLSNSGLILKEKAVLQAKVFFRIITNYFHCINT